MDVWFTNYRDNLWVVAAVHDEPPHRTPTRVTLGVSKTLRQFIDAGYKIDQVGICPPDMLGLE